MTTLHIIDTYQRKIISIFFRFTLLGYSLFLLFFEGSLFNWKTNSLVLISYIFVYFFLISLQQRGSIIAPSWNSKLRSLNDYALITFILYQLQDFNFYAFTLLLAPIINFHNHITNNKNYILYIFTLISLYIITSEFTFWYTVPLIFLLVINSFDNLRSKYYKFQQDLSSTIDDFFVDEKLFNKLERIYEKAIPVLNSMIFLKNVSKIICLKIENEKILVVNGSVLVWDLRIPNSKRFLKLIANKKTFFNFNFILEGKQIQYNIVNSCSINNICYCFIIFSEKNKNFNKFPSSFFISKLINPFFYRLSRILDADLKQKKNEMAKLNQLEEKMNYVSNAVNSMHFIRNKLGPVKSYLAMADDYSRTSDPRTKEKIEVYLNKERQKLSTSLSQILLKAEYILTKSNNPFNVYELQVYGVQELFSEIRRIWSYFFDTEKFTINWNIENLKFLLKYNSLGIDLVLSNWISNMSKYNNGDFGINFNENVDSYSVNFFNSYNDSKSIKFIEEFNKSERDEIIRRSSRGLFEVKDFLSQMNISHQLFAENTYIYFNLNFKKIII